MDEIFKCIIDWFFNFKDRNVVFCVCKCFYVIEGFVWELVFILNCYVIEFMIFVLCFLNVRFIIIKGKFCMEDYLFIFYVDVWGVFVMFWMDILVKFYRFMMYFKMKWMRIMDVDIECLISVCGEML